MKAILEFTKSRLRALILVWLYVCVACKMGGETRNRRLYEVSKRQELGKVWMSEGLS